MEVGRGRDLCLVVDIQLVQWLEENGLSRYAFPFGSEL